MTLTQEIFQGAIRHIIQAVGENPDREGLRDTPQRFSDALKFWTSGYNQNPADILKCFADGGENYDELVFQSNIQVFSLCEHHLTPFFGECHIAYIPYSNKIVGLSKLSRLLEIYARRFTVQERITTQVADALMSSELGPRGAAVVLQCRHMCMESRGIQKTGTLTTTTALRGVFMEDPNARAEFMSLVNAASK
jgi:GTP cyclohydrolase IA